MNRREINGPESAGGGSAARSASLPQQPNYSNKAVQEALKHMASIDLRELCNEAKVECCRATRDLGSCGRYVHHVLNSCGHASLCTECSQRCDVCPICRIPIPKTGNILRLRLYYKCIEAGLITQIGDETSQDTEEQENQLTTDVHRLYSLFDVAMENNLISMVCHYVTDVCMDEAAVSSNPVTAFLLDEAVVKDWVKRTFKNILAELQGIYNLEVKLMKVRVNILLKYSRQLAGISRVLEVLESAFKDSFSAQLQELQQLQENVLKAKQHLEIMAWCIRYDFLENVRSRYANFMSWQSLLRERKSAAIKRAWPDVVDDSSECNGQGGSLFIEDALENLEIDQEYGQEAGVQLEVASLQNDERSFFRSKIEGMSGSYPFENLRAATDILFLHGHPDMMVAKQAIFLYYLFDRHWTLPDENWKHIVDDFAATFSITRHSLLESFTFYLLDDHTDAGLQEACRILPEICGPETHPKIARVLLERQNPETALMVLRWSGRDGGSQLVSIGEAVTAIRVRVECGLLSEAFTYQRMLWVNVKENKLKGAPSEDVSDDLDGRNWMEWIEILVTEFCCLCFRRNLVDRIIELPWNSDEEKYLHKCLLDSATDDPSSTAGSLLVVFYLQRYRYGEAYQVNLKLQSLEENFISENSVSAEIITRMRSQSHWRTELVDKAIDLLPAVQQQQIRSGVYPETAVSSDKGAEVTMNSGLSNIQQPEIASFFIPSSTDSLPFHAENVPSAVEPSVPYTPSKLGWSINNPPFEVGHGSLSVLQERFFSNTGKGQKAERSSISKNLKFGEVSTPFKDLNRSASRALASSHLKESWVDKISPEPNANGFLNDFRNSSSPCPSWVTANPVKGPGSNRGFFNGSAQNLHPNVSAKGHLSGRVSGSWNLVSSDDPVDISSSYRNNDEFAAEDENANTGVMRWRSDEASDEEDKRSSSLDRIKSSHTNSLTRRRRGFTRR